MLVQILNGYVSDDADCIIAENPKSLMVVEGEVCIMIKLDGEWEYNV